MKTVDIKFGELCDEIDYWKEIAKQAEENAEYWKNEYHQHMNQSLINAKKGVANALMFALHATDDENGNLVINKESRKKIAETYQHED